VSEQTPPGAASGGTLTRLVAALAGLAVLVPAVVFGGQLAVEIIIPLVSLVAIAEYVAMAFPAEAGPAGRTGPMRPGLWVSLGFAAVYAATIYGSANTLAVAWAGVAVGSLIAVTFDGGPLEAAADRAGRVLIGVGWLGLLAFLVLLRRQEHGLGWVFLVLAASWLGDTGAYFAGRFLGRHPLYPRVSPKKTWEGVAGGIILATVGTLFIGAVAIPGLSVSEALVLGPVLCSLGVVGDLAESTLKRSFSVKDSGWILPGHGGLLDRIDSVMFVAPALYAWLWWRGGG
jgi:phosphatidate cytidylyltransferase